MRLMVFSDLHEDARFRKGDFFKMPEEGLSDTILVLAGDISTIRDLTLLLTIWKDFLRL